MSDASNSSGQEVSLSRSSFNEMRALIENLDHIIADRSGGGTDRRDRDFARRFFGELDSKSAGEVRLNIQDQLNRIKGSGIFSEGGQTAGAITGTSADIQREENGVESELSSFLVNIGEAVVDAQRELDKESERYLSETAGKDHLVSSVFKIPKVSANIKFAVNRRRGKKFGILVSRRKTESETSLNQGLDFEVMAVPPPPEVLSEIIKNGMPRFSFELSRSGRERIFNVIKNLIGKKKNHKLALLVDDENRDRVVILNVIPPQERASYLIFFAKEDASEKSNASEQEGSANRDNEVGVWYAQDLQNDTLEIQALIGFTEKARARSLENHGRLRDLVLFMAGRQEKILKGLF